MVISLIERLFSQANLQLGSLSFFSCIALRIDMNILLKIVLINLAFALFMLMLCGGFTAGAIAGLRFFYGVQLIVLIVYLVFTIDI